MDNEFMGKKVLEGSSLLLNTNKPLELLIVEDKDIERENAKGDVSDIMQKSGLVINTSYANNRDDALKMLKEKNYDGVVSDVFMPICEDRNIYEESNEKLNEFFNIIKDLGIKVSGSEILQGYNAEAENKISNAHGKWKQDWNIPPPAGIHILDYCKKNDIPITMCSDSERHSDLMKTIEVYASQNKIEIFNNKEDGKSKDWKQAIRYVIIEKILNDNIEQIKKIKKVMVKWSDDTSDYEKKEYIDRNQAEKIMKEKFNEKFYRDNYLFDCVVAKMESKYVKKK